MDIFEKVLVDYTEMGGGYMSMTPVTGDILMDKHLLERLDLIKRYPAIREVGVTTNAAMLDRFSDQEVGTIVDSFSRIQISIYGLDEEEYFAMTKRKTYDRAIDGIRRIFAVRSENIFLAFRLLKQRPMRDVHDWIQKIGCRERVQINSVMFGGYANFAALDTAKPLPFGATWSSTSQLKKQCLMPILALQISSNGDVGFCGCVGALEDLRLGSIKNNTLLELFNSSKNRALWDWAGNGIPESCARCTFYVPLESIKTKPRLLDRRWLDMMGA